jgi:hypothetical protein
MTRPGIMTRDEALALDRADPLAAFRDRFALPALCPRRRRRGSPP